MIKKMKISEKTWDIVWRQFDSDCGGNLVHNAGDAEIERKAAAPDAGKVRLRKGVRLPEKGGMSEEAYGEWVREILKGKGAMTPRVYEGIDPFFRGIVCGSRAWLMADERIFGWCEKEYVEKGGRPEWFWQFSDLKRLNLQMERFGRTIVDVRLHFLMAENAAPPEKPSFEVRIMEGDELWELEENPSLRHTFRHALCTSALQPGQIAVAAMHEGEIIGLAGATADCPAMWQIGVDVRPGWEGRGIGSYLVSLIGSEVQARGAVPFYGTSQSHVVSMNTAVKAGFLPAWSEVYVGRKE